MSSPVRVAAEQLAPYLLTISTEQGFLDYSTLFGNDDPVELEVGFGKGLFLFSESEARPDTNFLGIEIEKKYVFAAATRMFKHGGRDNVKLVHGDAREFLKKHIADQSLQAVHVYFPDPWWKTRHRKRRLFTPEFANECQRLLQRDGILYLVSDVEDYFKLITSHVDDCEFLEKLPAPEIKDPEHDLDYLTHFERKYRKEGRPIYRASYVRQ
ncbi:MAG: tRNA (guanosine(46)-N7)-methyltransferase TrmB [Gemmataceae bacterium]